MMKVLRQSALHSESTTHFVVDHHLVQSRLAGQMSLQPLHQDLDKLNKEETSSLGTWQFRCKVFLAGATAPLINKLWVLLWKVVRSCTLPVVGDFKCQFIKWDILGSQCPADDSCEGHCLSASTLIWGNSEILTADWTGYMSWVRENCFQRSFLLCKNLKVFAAENSYKFAFIPETQTRIVRMIYYRAGGKLWICNLIVDSHEVNLILNSMEQLKKQKMCKSLIFMHRIQFTISWNGQDKDRLSDLGTRRTYIANFSPNFRMPN